jgi:hypothetical protein
VEVDIETFRKAITGRLYAVAEATPIGIERAADRLVDAIHSHMGGRPGPYTRTGNLFESVRVGTLTDTEASVITDLVYSRRIELGFYGADSIGREYAQPPYSYFFPGVEDMMAGGFLETMKQAWGDAWEG